MSKDLVAALSDLQEEEALIITRDRLDAGEAPLGVLAHATRAMEIVGRSFPGEE